MRFMDFSSDRISNDSNVQVETWTDYSAEEKSTADKLITEHYGLLTRVPRSKRRRMRDNELEL